MYSGKTALQQEVSRAVADPVLCPVVTGRRSGRSIPLNRVETGAG
jgi:hypothetical protein